MIGQFILVFISALIFIFLSFYIGRIISNVVLGDIVFDNGVSLGLFFLSSVVGILYTKGSSIYIFPVILFIWFFIAKKEKNYFYLSKDIITNSGIVLLYFIYFFFLQYFVFYRSGDELSKAYADVYAYVSQINLMEEFGKETIFTELEKQKFGFSSSFKPYHYFEFWIAIGSRFILGSRTFFVYTFFLIPLLGSILIFQAFTVLRTIFRVRLSISFLIPLLVFTTLRYSYLDEWLFSFLGQFFEVKREILKAAFFQNYGVWHFFSYLHGLKLLVSSLFLLPFFIYCYQKNRIGMVVMLSLFPFVSVTYIPFVLIVSGLFFIFSPGLIRFRFLLPVFFVFLILGVYTYLGRSGSSVVEGFSFSRLFLSNFENFKFNYKKEIFIVLSDFFENFYWLLLTLSVFILVGKHNIWVKIFFVVVVLYPTINFNHILLFKFFIGSLLIVFAIVVFPRLKTIFQNKYLLLFFTSLVLLRVALFFIGDIYDVFQSFSLIWTPFIFIFILFLIGREFSNQISRVRYYFIVALSLVLISVQSYGLIQENRRPIPVMDEDKAFYRKIFKWLPNHEIVSGYYSPFTLVPYLHYDRIGVELLHRTDKFYTTCLSMGELTKKDSSVLKYTNGYQLLSSMPFSIWLKENKSRGLSYDLEQVGFIRDRKIKIIFRKDEYERGKINFLNPYLADSVYNHQGKYWAYFIVPKINADVK